MTDIVGSTEHAAELGDSGWRELVQVHHGVIRDALRRHGGREIDTAGDGFFAIFDAPAAAVNCGLDAAEQVGKLGVEIRVGVHVGEVEQAGGKVAGITVPIASRIMASAGPGEVLVSSTVRDLAAGSGLTFEDRGVRPLKGVPGEWHVFAVGRAEPEAGVTPAATSARERRAAAVRRAGARPIWERRPRLVAATAVGLALILATSGLLVWKPWQPALASVTENAIGVIDPDRNEVIGQILVGTRPGGIAVGEGYAWVTNTDDDTVSQIDLATHAVIDDIDVGRQPKGIAVAEGSVWVANSGDRTVSWINVATGRVVADIPVGNGPTAIASADSSVWVANATDSTVVSIDPRTGTVGQRSTVAAAPIALAVDESGLWVVSEDAASVSHLDAVTGVPLAAPIQLGRTARPSAVALSADSVWVASVNGTVTRIDPTAHEVIDTIVVGGNLAAVASDGSALWVGDRDGYVFRFEVGESSPPKIITTGTAVASLEVVDGQVWLAAQASSASHRGGTLRIVQFLGNQIPRYMTDPLVIPFFNVTSLEADGLVGYRHVGGAAGAVLLADLATSVPDPTNGGLTYTFQLRPDLVYSTGEPVRAGDFQRAIERSFQIPTPLLNGLTNGAFLFPSVVGAEACATADGGPVERCHLPRGIRTDDDARTVTFHLSTPDPDFLYKLASPAAYPVPEEGVPMNEILDDAAFPGTGPYTVTAVKDNQVRLERNPLFRVWDRDVRPDGFPGRIIFTVIEADTVAEGDTRRIAMVENGYADLTSFRYITRTSPDLFARIKTRYPGQWHVASADTQFVEMDSSVPPFDSIDARKAVNFAIDRAYMAELAGGSDAQVTCQLLPPGVPGYEPYCPWTLDPDAGGRWHERDMQAAQRLINASGTRGAQVVVGPTYPESNDQLVYLGSVLEELGYEVSIETVTSQEELYAAWDARPPQITIGGWVRDYFAPANFLGLFTCGGEPSYHCDPDFDAAFDHALELQTTDEAAAWDAWAALDRRGVELAILAPVMNGGGDFVSARVENYQFHVSGFVLFDQMWVQ